MADLAEKVKFWEEQQEINDLLIPRVVGSAKAMEALTKRLTHVTDTLVAQQVALDAATKRIAVLEAARRRATVLTGLTVAVALIGGIALTSWVSGIFG